MLDAERSPRGSISGWGASLFFALFVFSLLALLTLAACSNQATSQPTATSQPAATAAAEPPGGLVVFAATSLTQAFADIEAAFEARHPQLSVVYHFAGTPTLRTQLEQGARADVFASANQPQMDQAVASGVVQGSPRLFAANRLVVVAPAKGGIVASLDDLAKPGVRIVLALKDVPAGGYARDAIAKMDASGRFEPGFAAKVLGNLASEETNVGQVMAKVALGEADAAIVYATDVTQSVAGRVRVIAIPDEFNVVAMYPVAVVKGTAQPDAAEAFVAFVAGPEGQAILARYGFGPVP